MTNNEREILGFNSGQTDMQPRQDPAKREGAPVTERAAFGQEETCLMSCEDRYRRFDDAVFCFNCYSDHGIFFVCCLTQLCLDCHELLFSHDPQCCSQLNGNNGEWTNTDDMKTGKEINDENKRRNREAYTHRKRAGGSNKKNMKKPPIEKISVSNDDTTCSTIDTPEEETCIHLYARLNNCVLYYSKRHGIYVNQLDGVQYECCFDGDWVNGSWDSSRDSFLRHQGPETYKLLDFSPNASFSYFGNKYTLYGEIYSPMLVEALTMDMPLPSEDKRNLRAIQAFIVKRFRLVPDEIQQSSIMVYLYKLSLISPSALPADTVWQNYTPMPCQLFTRQRMWIFPTDCKIPNDWNFNCRFKIQTHGNASFQLGDDWRPFNTPFIEHPRFTGKIEPDKSRYVNVALCKIKPSSDFEYYEVSGRNCTPALSRLLKSRTNEEVLAQNQLNLFDQSWQRVLEICNARISSGYLYTRNYDSRVNSGRYKIEKHENYKFYRIVDQARLPKNSWLSFFYKMLLVINYGLVNFHKIIRGFVQQTVFVTALLAHYCYSPFYQFYDKVEWLKHVAQLPCPKRPLYINWVENERDLAKILANSGEFSLKLKREEGKPGKATRLYGSGDHLCLVDKVLPDVVKNDDRIDIELNSLFQENGFKGTFPGWKDWKFIMRFSNAQEAKSSDELYLEGMKLAPMTVLFVYFSDDSFLLEKDEFGRVRLFEIDISSCDSSNLITIFGTLHELLSAYNPESADLLIAQASRRAKLVNPDEPESWFTFTPDTYFEYSGLLITTLLNNCASRKIFTGIFLRRMAGEDIASAIVSGARDCGYIVTCDEYESFNQVTFLKRAFSERSNRSWKVLGTLLRGFGVVEGEVTPEMLNVPRSTYRLLDDSAKFEKLCTLRLLSEVNEPGNPVLNALRERFGLPTTPDEVSTLDLIDRYGGEIWEWESFYMQLGQLQLGSLLTHTVVDRIFLKDYGVKPTVPP